MKRRSIELIRVSVGTAGVLGLVRVPMAVAPTTAYLMLGDRCVMNCAFCAQAQDSKTNGRYLSRVTWPEYPLNKVCARLKRAEHQGLLQRCCIQVTAGKDAYQEALHAIHKIRRATFLPLNVAILPANIGQIVELIESGVDGIGFGLDAASERVFQETKRLHWEHMLSIIESTADRFPGIASVHLIVGLGESEREMVERMLWVRDLGLNIGLFAFTPIQGTPLADRSQPPLSQYRRMQAARWLILNHSARITNFSFSAYGALSRINLVGWRNALLGGEAFRTSGCPACNRPFYNERPGGTTYNYARPLTEDEAAQALSDTEVE
jgi:biotin synthase